VLGNKKIGSGQFFSFEIVVTTYDKKGSLFQIRIGRGEAWQKEKKEKKKKKFSLHFFYFIKKRKKVKKTRHQEVAGFLPTRKGKIKEKSQS
jgi:hypothetical protein